MKRPLVSENLKKVSIQRIKKEMRDVSYLSDDLVITSLDARSNTTAEHPVTIDGFSVIIMMAGEAVVSIDMKEYQVRPNNIVFFNPGSIIRTVRCSANAAAFVLAFSKSFVNEIQIDLSASLPVYMRFGRAPVLEISPQDVAEIRQLQARELDIRSTINEPTDVDGQKGAEFPLHIECLAGGLQVMGPHDSL